MATGDPTGEDLCVGTIEAGDLTSDHLDGSTDEIIFDSSVELISGVKYAIVVRTETNEEHLIEWGQHTEDAYANGLRCYSFNAGDSWTQYPTRDNYFITKADGVAKDSNSGATISVLSFFNDRWAAQTFIASSTYTITSVILALWKDNAGTIGTITVSIRRTETTFTPPSSGPDITAVRRLVVATKNKIYYENI